MRKMLWMTAALLSPVTMGCGSDLNQALLLAGESGARTALDVLVSDFYSDLPELFSLPPGPGEPAGGEEGDSGAEQDDATPTGGGDGADGDAQNGAATYTANGCSGCHCDDASGGCLSGAPSLQGEDFATIQELLQGDTPHMGGKFDELTDQDLADLEAFLTEQADG